MMTDEYSLEWDDEKNEINMKKHGIRFEDAGLGRVD